MLHIVGSMKTLKGESQSAINLCRDIIGTLKSVTPDSNLTEKVGIFVRQMPDYKVLARDVDSAKQVLRKVCSGEIAPKEAIELFDSAMNQLETIQKMFSAIS